MTNPILAPSCAPFGAPRFDLIKVEHYEPAFREAIALAKAEIDAITANPESPNFENTIEALEYSGDALARVEGIFFNLLEADSNEQMQKIAEEMTPLLTEFGMYVSMNEALFARVKAVHDAAPSLDTDQARLLEDTYRGFIRGGAGLSEDAREEFRRISEELDLAELAFSNNNLAASHAWVLHVTDASQVDGMPAFVQQMGASEAASRGLSGWVFTLDRPSYTPFMKHCRCAELRREMYLHYNSRALGGEFDNRPLISKIVNLRLRKAQLLGYGCYADYALERRMASDKATVLSFLDRLAGPSLPKARAEISEIYSFALSKGYCAPRLEAWDFEFWAERFQEEKYCFTEEQLKPYFTLDATIDAVLGLAGRLYGLSFVQRDDIPVYHKDVKVFEVLDCDGSYLALFYADFFPRESKRGGAWMTEFRGQYRTADGVDHRPFISIVANLSKPSGDGPALLSHYDLTTFLHEFGHALHGMLSKGRYPSLCGTNVARDFVELPSQIMENWGYEKEYLDTFAKHYVSGESIPSEYLDKLISARNFLSGYLQVRQLRFGVIDMAWHTLTEPFEGDVMAFEQQALAAMDVLPVVEGCGICPSFGHIFSGGYSAGYYSYKWAEVLEADGFELFAEKGIFSREAASAFRHEILEKGSSEDEALLYRRFRGHDPAPEALLRKLGI